MDLSSSDHEKLARQLAKQMAQQLVDAVINSSGGSSSASTASASLAEVRPPRLEAAASEARGVPGGDISDTHQKLEDIAAKIETINAERSSLERQLAEKIRTRDESAAEHKARVAECKALLEARFTDAANSKEFEQRLQESIADCKSFASAATARTDQVLEMQAQHRQLLQRCSVAEDERNVLREHMRYLHTCAGGSSAVSYPIHEPNELAS
jgi:hypothetical protein